MEIHDSHSNIAVFRALDGLLARATFPVALVGGAIHACRWGNKKFFELIRSAKLGHPLSGVLGTEEISVHRLSLERVYETGESFVRKNVLIPTGDEAMPFPGSYFDVHYSPYSEPEESAVSGVLLCFHPVNELVQMRIQNKENERRYRFLADTLPQLMWTAAPDGRVNYANERCLDYTGMNSQEKYGNGWIHAIHSEDLPAVKAAWAASMSSNSPFKEEYRLRRHDGEYRWFLGRAIPIKDSEGSVQYWIGTATDIDDQKKSAAELAVAKDAAEKANAMKSAFLANMSHEIRTPLGAIIGFSGLLKDPELSEEERDIYIETIQRNGKSLTRIIDDILDLAKVEANRLDIEETEFSFAALLEEVLALFRERTAEKNISLTKRIDANVPATIHSDPTRLRQILINIVGNAVKFTDRGGVHVWVRSESLENNGERILISVEDTGRGLTAEQKERLFQPFTQADNTTTRRFGGTGLGLALSKRLSEALGGTITIDRFVPGQGCTFVVSFVARRSPRSRCGTLAGEMAILEPVPSSMFLKGKKVLLAEDSPDNQLLVTHILTKQGATVEVASNGEEAVEKASRGAHDLVLMDIQMPKMDGYQAMETLKRGGYSVPVIALTAHAMTEERVRTKQAGFTNHLTKPLSARDLLQALREHI